MRRGGLTGTGCIVVLIALLPGASIPYPWAPPSRPERLSDQFALPEDLEVTLWAESPMFYNPTNIDIDARGRVWVTEAVNYRDFNNHDGHRQHPQGDRVVILEDTDADGKADASKVFVQDEQLRSPLGIAVIGNQVVVSNAPNLIVYTDRDGNDRPDDKQVLLTGFGGFDHDHSLHAVVAGPDGRWYFNTGNAGPHVVTDRSGWTLRSGSVYTGGSPYNTENQGGMVSDDGRVWVGGMALRMEPDGTDLEVLAHNFRNNYEVAVDSYGNLWQNDNDDQVMTCRTTWVMEGGNHGYFSADGTRYWQADRRPWQDAFTAHWHQDDPGVIPAGDNTGAGSPTGVVVYEGDQLGERYRGMLLSADAGRNVVFAYWPQPNGAGFELKRTDFIATKRAAGEGYVWDDEEHARDEQKWFRPSDVAVGPDGAIYVADWYDPVVGGHQMHDRIGYGRIYRITPKGRKLSTPTLDRSTTEGQIEALLSPAINVRSLGFERLRARGEEVVDETRALLTKDNPYHRARAVWLLSRLGPNGIAVVEDLLTHTDAQIRVTAFRALRQTQPDVLPYARRLVNDTSAAVRREVAIALRDVPLESSKDLIIELARQYDGEDRWYLEAFGIAAEGKEEALYAALYERLGSAPPSWDARFAGLAWRLHPVSAVEAFKERADAPDVSEAERRRALTALAFVNDPKAAQAMADLTHSGLADVAEQASWWLQYRKTNDWRSYMVEGWVQIVPEALSRPLAEVLELRDTVLDEAAWVNAQEEAALEMARDPQGGALLISLFGDGKLPYQAVWAASTALASNPDPTVRYLAGHTLGRQGREVDFDVERIAGLEADRERGQAVFYASCATCHRSGTVGGDVGPDLTQIRAKLDRSALVDAIVRPGAGIVFGYEPSMVRLRNGRVQFGIVLSDGEALVLKDAAGQRHVVEKQAVAGRETLPVTLMPAPSDLGLSEQDVADVAAFLLAFQ